MKAMRSKFVLGGVPALTILAVGLAAALTIVPAGSVTPSGTTISTRTGAFGTMLDVGSGKYAGYTVYFITSDQPPTYGCTTKAISLFGMPLVCAGPSNDKNAEWPAVTTTGTPVAGPGVNQKLLGTVHRAGIGGQVRGLGRAQHPALARPVVPHIALGQAACMARHAHDAEGPQQDRRRCVGVHPCWLGSLPSVLLQRRHLLEEHLRGQLQCCLATRAQLGKPGALELAVIVEGRND